MKGCPALGTPLLCRYLCPDLPEQFLFLPFVPGLLPSPAPGSTCALTVPLGQQTESLTVPELSFSDLQGAGWPGAPIQAMPFFIKGAVVYLSQPVGELLSPPGLVPLSLGSYCFSGVAMNSGCPSSLPWSGCLRMVMGRRSVKSPRTMSSTKSSSGLVTTGKPNRVEA